MTLATDIADDMADVDNLETITLSVGGVSDSSVSAFRRAATYMEVQAGGSVGLDSDDLAWNIQANTTTLVPTGGATITDGDSVVWRVLSVQGLTLSTRWRCMCRRELCNGN